MRRSIHAYVGPAIRAIRKEQGLTVDRLGPLVPCTWKHISTIENGHQQGSLRMLEAIANALGMTLTELIARAEKLAQSGGVTCE